MSEAAPILLPPTSRHRRGRFMAALAVIGFLIALGFLVHALNRVKEPVYQGKRLSVWLADTHWTNGGHTVLSPASTQAVQAMGTNALPYLLYMVQRRDSTMERDAAVFLWSHWHLRFPMRSDDNVKAWYGFHALGVAAKPVYPDLVKMVLASDNAGWAINALTDADADTVASVAEGVHSPNVKVRRRAVFALAFIRQAPVVAVPALTEALNDPDLEVQNGAAGYIGLYGPAAKSALPALAKLTNAADSGLQMMASVSLEKINVPSTNGTFDLNEGKMTLK